MNRPLSIALAAALALAACAEEQAQTPPRQIASSPFHYPEDLWDAEVEGETTLRLFVSDDGVVDSIAVERSSGYAAFDTAAVNGATELRFEPARRGEESVATWIYLPVRFEMPRDPSADAAGGAPQDSLPAEPPAP